MSSNSGRTPVPKQGELPYASPMWLNTVDLAGLFVMGVAVALLIVSAVLFGLIVVLFLDRDRGRWNGEPGQKPPALVRRWLSPVQLGHDENEGQVEAIGSAH